eukprot:294234-Pyramimonas_sp.AAC.1
MPFHSLFVPSHVPHGIDADAPDVALEPWSGRWRSSANGNAHVRRNRSPLVQAVDHPAAQQV